jgi:hypothetical protein
VWHNRQMPDTKRDLLRHTLATLAYRGAKALRDAPPAFESFRASEGSRSAGQILAHIGDLLDWGLALAQGRKEWRDSPALPWPDGATRFFAALADFDAFLASSEALARSEDALFQGPVADALTHVGQISLLRRLAGSPVKGENYFRAEIAAGRVGPQQTPPRAEF